MPQMKPMNWIILFYLMNMIIMIMIIKNYFIKMINLLHLSNNNNNNLMLNNWKW